MELLSEELQHYLESHCEPEPPVLKHLDRETNLKVPLARMLSGHYQGRVLSMFSHLLKPQRILEIGSFTGYATVCLAEGLQSGGLIHTIEINPELEERLLQTFKEANIESRVRLHIGDAALLIPQIAEVFDLVFIDADKKNNERYYHLVFEKLRPGGLIIVDNVLWGGKVLDRSAADAQTQRIDAFNRMIADDARVEKLILPVRDGIFVIRKKSDTL